ncbi:30S ribosomal protein S20 [Caldicellulosiruptor changbaiensis]|uniref:Small ribosomal subunit protein bS20 n=2 Tax=Caldicellulosiruptor TaxID=44000 RepID=RS20_CALS8|nr:MULTISPECIES: 30S ribosomal protein S20 [Caldicellulosiruptor]A4XIA5.1 RecName: Full=Small ribosomal subunit protein bS20; AltName: Full=30S ribosomal protein S20 [Caldicellulosiruptor saccharolyticus DSM 8903]ABP66640.1 ribosomal protein S20 [Caldicellulosiruptor saccharolyticus DSM 8903]AZT90896.1 30S ribosomal protein S20 [Caldicellulosiruptor changbaiensis]
MANTKSAKKKIKVIRRRTIENKIQKFKMKKAIKEVKKALLAGDIEKAKELYSKAAKLIDQTAAKGVIHKNNASRKKSRLMKLINKYAALSTPQPEKKAQ